MTLSKSGQGLGQSFPRFEDQYAVWNKAIDPEFDAKSNKWFSDFKLTPIGRYLQERDETPKTLRQIEHWLDDFFKPEEIMIIDGLIQQNIELLGNAIDIETSSLGSKIIEALGASGLAWRYASLSALAPLEWPVSLWPVDELPQDDKTKIEIFFNDGEQFTVLQYIQVLKDKRGKETAMWFAPQMAASRPMHQITRWYVNNSDTGKLEYDEIPQTDLGKVMNYGEWSEQIALPILFKKLFMLAEAGADAFTTEGSRAERFSHLKPAELPNPVLFFETKGELSGTWLADDQTPVYTLQKFPHVAYQGWIFKDETVENLAKTFNLFFDGLKRVQYVLTNGFLGNFAQNWSGSWDRYTLSAMLMIAPEQRKKVNGAAFWTPALFCALNSAVTQGDYNNARQPDTEHEKEVSVMAKLSNTGTGPAVTSAINTYAFSHLLPEKEFDLAKRLLELAYLMDVPRESLTALSNIGIAEYMANKLDAAEEIFKQVIASDERTSDDEAYAYLSAISKVRGDSKLAEEYDALCKKAGGYESPIFERSEQGDSSLEPFTFDFDIDENDTSSGLTKNSLSGLGVAVTEDETPSGATRGAFCGQCGNKFTSDEQNFCGGCGSPRK